MNDIKQDIIDYLNQCEAYAYVPDVVEFIEQSLDGASIVPTGVEMWRDLAIGEEIKLGDRACGIDHKWFEIKAIHLEYRDVVCSASYPTQRNVNS